MKVFFTITVIVLLFVIGCTPKPIPIEIPELEPKLVLNTQIIPNQFIVVGLTRTIGALNFSEENGDSSSQQLLDSLLVENADVVVSYRDVSDTLIMVQPGLYVGLTTPQYDNEVYSITCFDPEKDLSCSASSLMLQHVPFDTLIPSLTASVDTSVNIHFEFTDLPGENYYMINVYKQKGENEEGSGADVDNIFPNGSNVLLVNEVFADNYFSSSNIVDDIQLDNINLDDSIAITLSHISEDYFRYIQLRKKSSNWFSEITKEPINYPTNVNGGYGFFNTHYPDIRYFLIEDL